MLRWMLLRLAGSEAVAGFARNSAAVGKVVERYVAGESLEAGVAAARALAAQGMDLTIDHVGELVDSMQQAEQAAEAYRRLLDRIQDEGLAAGVSIKPTQLGLLIDRDACAELLLDLAKRAAAAGVHVTLDMEDHTVTEATVQMVERAHEAGASNVGCALQSYLHRTPEDVRRLTRLGASIRLCKGAYAEPTHVAHQRDVEVARAYLDDARYLLREGTEPRFATHDHHLVAAIKREAAILGRDRRSYEFQMLYGVRPDMQRALVDDGYRLRLYLPYGTEWYAYFTRRLAERPANLMLFARSLLSARRDVTSVPASETTSDRTW